MTAAMWGRIWGGSTSASGLGGPSWVYQQDTRGYEKGEGAWGMENENKQAWKHL